MTASDPRGGAPGGPTRAPDRPGADDAGLVDLRRFRWWDLPAVLTIEADLFGAESWSPAVFWSELAQRPTRHYLVAVTGTGDLVGYAGLCVYPDAAFVQTMAVARPQWGRGIGARLLTALLDEAERRDRSSVGLEVRADNPRAQALYERFGFVPVDRRRGYYQPSGVDAVVMMREPA